MSPVIEIRDPADLRQYLLQGFCLQRIVLPRADRVAAVCDWALALAAEGEPVPPLGFVADIGHAVFRAATSLHAETLEIAGWPATLTRAYADTVLGRLLADSMFERAGDALRTYTSADRARGLAFLIAQLRNRVGIPGGQCSPSLLKTLRDADGDELLAEAIESFHRVGPMPMLLDFQQQIVQAMRQAVDLLGAEDVFELERRTAVAAFGQRVALRQTLQAAAVLDATLPRQKPRTVGRRHEVATNIREDDLYPVGGYSSLSTRGSIESLLHSQLVFMEKDDRPDLFDVKFLRDELLYYARDENTFLRRRRTFLIALWPDLTVSRRKDVELPWQRIILLLAFLDVALHRSIDWLRADSLTYEILLISTDGQYVLDTEQELLEMLFRDQIDNGTVTIQPMPAAKLPTHAALRSRRSLCHLLLASASPREMHIDGVDVARLTLDAPAPSLEIAAAGPPYAAEDTPLACWTTTLERLLTHWI
ncbi:MAG: hypothetical protein EXS16_04550 [Gemmataceae bacterium]|nr:hypothetical protein [Gemmataceae bacterium]